jgi:flagellar hook-associated protein 3 FlgL
VADGIVMQVNVPGDSVYEGSLNAFDVLIDLRDALGENNVDGVRESLSSLADMREKISSVRGEIGARVNRMELTRNVLDRVTTEMTTILSEDEDVDLTSTIVNLQQEQDVFQAALASGNTVIPQSLMDFIG